MPPAMLLPKLIVRAMVAIATIACALPAATQGCDTGSFTLRGDYEGARLGACSVVGPAQVTLDIPPEDGGRINPSPWYGFHVWRHGDIDELRVTLRYGDHRHRYVPKVSADGEVWQALDEGDVTLHEDGSATLRLRPGADGLRVSAQENLGLAYYARWRARVRASSPGRWEEIGRSVDGRPIHAFVHPAARPDARAYILLIGRQHPPEIPGALAMATFVDRLLGIAASCAGAAAAAELCALFDDHALVIVPLLNPDGVALGHWRHNLGHVDLNRDWGPFTQPETQAVRDLVERFETEQRPIRLMLDFHSTNRNVFYIQDAASPTRPGDFAAHWLDRADATDDLYDHERAPRPLTETGTAKNYFHRRFGIPSITFEVADEEDRERIAESAVAFAEALAEALPAALQAEAGQPCADLFCHLAEANAASLVMLAEEQLMPADRAAAIARALDWIDEEQARPDAARSGNYLNLEERLIELVGTDGADLHIGRSRQDLHGTARRMMARQHWQEVTDELLDARAAAIRLAGEHAATVVPAYTHGVQAQPTTYGHIVLAFSAALGRDANRLAEGYARLNRSPLGAAALGTSSFPLNRHRLAELLGFDAPVGNSFDANLISSADYKAEFAAILSQSALAIGQFAQNLHTQYHDPQPWMQLAADQTSGSSIMPQKRNPRPIDRLRSAASRVVGVAQTIALLAHNAEPGMHDYRDASALVDLAEQAALMYRRYARLLSSIEVDAERALVEVGRGYSTMTEVADTLVRDAGVPFRLAHGYASALTDLARSTARAATSLADDELHAVYTQTVGGKLPVPPGTVRRAMDPQAMVAGRRGFGGPQATEMARAIAVHKAELAEHRARLAAAREQRLEARLELRARRDALAAH